MASRQTQSQTPFRLSPDENPLGTENFGNYYLQDVNPAEAQAIQQAATGGQGWNILRGVLAGAGALAGAGGSGGAQIPLALLGGLVGGIGQGVGNSRARQALEAQLSGVTNSIGQNNQQFMNNRNAIQKGIAGRANLMGAGGTPFVTNNLYDASTASDINQAIRMNQEFNDPNFEAIRNRMATAGNINRYEDLVKQGFPAPIKTPPTDPLAGKNAVIDPTTGAQLSGQVSATGQPVLPDIGYLWSGENALKYAGTPDEAIKYIEAANKRLGGSPSEVDERAARAEQARAQASEAPSVIERNYADARRANVDATVGIPAGAERDRASAGQATAQTEAVTLETAQKGQWRQLAKQGKVLPSDVSLLENTTKLSKPQTVRYLRQQSPYTWDKIAKWMDPKTGKPMRDKAGNAIYYDRKTFLPVPKEAFQTIVVGGSKAKDDNGSSGAAKIEAQMKAYRGSKQ